MGPHLAKRSRQAPVDSVPWHWPSTCAESSMYRSYPPPTACGTHSAEGPCPDRGWPSYGPAACTSKILLTTRTAAQPRSAIASRAASKAGSSPSTTATKTASTKPSTSWLRSTRRHRSRLLLRRRRGGALRAKSSGHGMRRLGRGRVPRGLQPGVDLRSRAAVRWRVVRACALIACGTPDEFAVDAFAGESAHVICKRTRECMRGLYEATYSDLPDCERAPSMSNCSSSSSS